MKKLLYLIPILGVAAAGYFYFNLPSSSNTLTLDSGIRADYGSNPFVISNDGETLTLAYELRTTGLKASPQEGTQIVTTTDGISFIPYSGIPPEISPFPVQLDDGIFRRYKYDRSLGGVVSESSSDGINFTKDSGLRYTIKAEGEFGPAFGVATYYVDGDGGVVLLYNSTGENGEVIVNRAYAADGNTFVFQQEDILHGTLPTEFYADPNALTLSNGDIWLIVMNQGEGGKPPMGKQGVLYVYKSTDGGRTFSKPERVIGYDDISTDEVYSLNDPKLVEFPTGTVRIYFAAMVADSASTQKIKEDAYKYILLSVSSKL